MRNLARHRIQAFRGFDPKQFSNGNLKSYLHRYLMTLGLATEQVLSFIHEKPLRHKGSEAYYYADFYIGGEHRVLLGFMPPYSKSTTHFHEEPLVEEYCPLAGQLYLNGEPISPEGLLVKPHTIHQASTKEVEAITLIIMHNAGRIPEDKQHILVNS